MAALIVITVLAFSGACFVSKPPCFSYLRQRTRH